MQMAAELNKAVTKNSDHSKEIIKLIKQVANSRSIYQVFNDFLEMSAIAVSNSVDPIHREKREARHLEIIKSYDKKHQQLFPLMFFHLVQALEEKAQTKGPEDVLGIIFHELELHNKYKAQFFTPVAISDCMTQIAIGDETQKAIEEKGFISLFEPACGSGVMVISACKAMSKLNLNYCGQLVVTAVDCDLKCAHMTYLQLSLYGVPAVVIHGNSLLLKEFSRWYTPIYLMNNWIWRAPCGIIDGYNADDEKIKCALEPTYAAFKMIAGKLRDIEAGISEDEANNVVINENPIITNVVDDTKKQKTKKSKRERYYEPIQPSLFG